MRRSSIGLDLLRRAAPRTKLSRASVANSSNTVKVFPLGIAKIHGELHSAETPGNTPFLVSGPFMEELGTVIDIGNNTVSFTKIDVKGLPLIKTA